MKNIEPIHKNHSMLWIFFWKKILKEFSWAILAGLRQGWNSEFSAHRWKNLFLPIFRVTTKFKCAGWQNRPHCGIFLSIHVAVEFFFFWGSLFFNLNQKSRDELERSLKSHEAEHAFQQLYKKKKIKDKSCPTPSNPWASHLPKLSVEIPFFSSSK